MPKLLQTLFELAFVVTRDNAILDKLQLIAFLADFVQVRSPQKFRHYSCVFATRCSTPHSLQVFAYVFDPKIPWGLKDVQYGLGGYGICPRRP